MNAEELLDLTERGIATPASFARVASRGLWQLTPHLSLLNYYALQVFAGNIDRLMVFMPPRHGKSNFLSQFVPAWYLGMRPHHRVMLATYEAQFSQSWGRAVRNLINEFGPSMFGIRVSDDSRAQNRFNIDGTNGGMITAGVGGSLTGRGGDLMLLDDPIKNDAQANSPTFRENTWQWWRATWRTRLQKGGAMIQVNTRWHEDDLSGRILQQAAETGDNWTVVNLPAIAEKVEDDVMGWHREPGQALWPEMFDVEMLNSIERDVGSYWWNALYQQRPTSLGGDIFKRAWFRYWHADLEDQNYYVLMQPDGPRRVPKISCQRFLTVDPAVSTSTHADYTAIGVWALTPAGELILLDVVRDRIEGPEQPAVITSLFMRWKCNQIWVETVAYQLSLFQTLRRSGLPVLKLDADKDKVSRALTIAARMQSGDVYFPQHAEWLGDYESELLVFNKGEHDDQVDMTSYAGQVLMKRRSGPQLASH